jgi:hypothetical protein
MGEVLEKLKLNALLDDKYWMLSLPIYLYPNVYSVILDLDTTASGVNQVMYQRDLKIQKGVKNKVQILFKNSDQKRITIDNSSTVVFSIFDAINQRLLLEKAISILDDTVITRTVQDQLQISNVLTFSSATTVAIGQSISGFGIKPNSVIISVNRGVVTLNNFTTYPVSSSTALTVSTQALRGVGEIDFFEADTADLDIGDYKFSIKYLDQDGEYLPAYSDSYYGIDGTLHLACDIHPLLTPSQTITSFLKKLDTNTNLYYYPSGNIYAFPEYNSNNSALHTVALYMTNFRGTVTVRGTLSNQPNQTNSYATITTLTYNGTSGIDYYNFNGVYTYIQIIYTPATRPGDSVNDDPSYFGSFDMALYRS